MELTISEDEHLNGILITGNFTADRDKALAWSGVDNGVDNRIKAEELRHQEYQTIEDTQGGEALSQALPYEDIESEKISKDDYDRYWSEASNRFSTSQEGDITTRVVGALEDRDFIAVELPNFIADTKVTSINGIPREELAVLYEISPREAFNRICEAEKSRNLQHEREDTAKPSIKLENDSKQDKTDSRVERLAAAEKYFERRDAENQQRREREQGQGLGRGRDRER